jgi:hypothetical protein
MPLAEEDFADQEDNELFRCIKCKNWSQTMSLLSTKDGQQMATQQDVYGSTPLHAALGYKAPDSLVVFLLKIFPEATKVHGTGDDWLPLHVAAMWGASSTVMEALIRANPQALDDLGEGGLKGRTPRHFSQRFSHNRELLERSTEDWIALIESERVATERAGGGGAV